VYPVLELIRQWGEVGLKIWQAQASLKKLGVAPKGSPKLQKIDIIAVGNDNTVIELTMFVCL